MPSLTSSLFPLFPSLCAIRNAEGHPVTMWIVVVHLWVQLCPQYPLCMTHILSAKFPASCYVPTHLFFSRYLRAEIFRKLPILSLRFGKGSRSYHTPKNDLWCSDCSFRVICCSIKFPFKQALTTTTAELKWEENYFVPVDFQTSSRDHDGSVTTFMGVELILCTYCWINGDWRSWSPRGHRIF